MVTLTTKDIKITAQVYYRSDYSEPINEKYIYSYRINIHNLGKHSVQLLRRHWFIMDAFGNIREVEGEGVIGKQPLIDPAEYHQYESWSHLMTAMGKMWGTYLMYDFDRDVYFKAIIPQFELHYPLLSN